MIYNSVKARQKKERKVYKMSKYNLDEIQKEKKTIRHGIRFKKSIMLMLKEIADTMETSKAEMLERLIIDKYKKMNK